MSVQWQLLDWKIDINRDSVIIHMNGEAINFPWEAYTQSNAKLKNMIEYVRRANCENPQDLMEFPFTNDEPWSQFVMPGAFALRFLSAFGVRKNSES